MICIDSKQKPCEPLMIKWKDRGSYKEVKNLVIKFYTEVSKLIKTDSNWIEKQLKKEGI